jgi:hypothetical protein
LLSDFNLTSLPLYYEVSIQFAGFHLNCKYGFLQLTVADVKNSSEDIEMIPAVDVGNIEDPNDESAVVSAVITNVGAAPCMGTITSEASLGNMHLEDVVPETKDSGTSSGFTGPADTEKLSNDQQQVRKIILHMCLCISSLVFKQSNYPGSKGYCSSIKEAYSFWSSVWKTSCWTKARSFPRVFKCSGIICCTFFSITNC